MILWHVTITRWCGGHQYCTASFNRLRTEVLHWLKSCPGCAKVLPMMRTSCNHPGRKWVKVFKNGPSKICRRQPLKNLKWYGLFRQTISLQFFQTLFGQFLNNLTQKRLDALSLVNDFTKPIGHHNLSLFHSFLNFSLIVTKSTNAKVHVNPVMKQRSDFWHWNHSFNTYAKFTEKVWFPIPWYVHIVVRIRGKETLVFWKI